MKVILDRYESILVETLDGQFVIVHNEAGTLVTKTKF